MFVLAVALKIAARYLIRKVYIHYSVFNAFVPNFVAGFLSLPSFDNLLFGSACTMYTYG